MMDARAHTLRKGFGLSVAKALLLFMMLLFSRSIVADDLTSHFRFGILRPTGSGGYEIARETTRLPKKIKATGFRWGVAFDNPTQARIEWYEVVKLPSTMRELSGNYDQNESTLRILRTQTQMSSQPTVVDDFWFDEGDPVGKHLLKLYVNGKLCFTVAFEVVEGE